MIDGRVKVPATGWSATLHKMPSCLASLAISRLIVGSFVAATTKVLLCRSSCLYTRCASSVFGESSNRCIALLTCGATTVMCAPAFISKPDLRAAAEPAPTTRQLDPLMSRNIGS